MVKSEKAIDLANDKVALVTMVLIVENEKTGHWLPRLVTSMPKLATHWICYQLGWSLYIMP